MKGQVLRVFKYFNIKLIKFYFIALVSILFSFKSSDLQTTFFNKNKFHKVNIAILQLFKQFPIVAIGEGQHNSKLTFEWLTTLIDERQFSDFVQNIVVEFGASEYQWVMDDFVNNKDIPDSLFKKCWRETTQIMVWDNPIYEQFFKVVRKKNKSLPQEKRIRVLLGDASFGTKTMGDEHSFQIVEKEVIQKKQTALLIYGDLHFVRKDIFTNYADPKDVRREFLNIIQILDIQYPGKSFCIWGSVNTNDSITKNIIRNENIKIPCLIHIKNTELGHVDFRTFYPYPTDFRTDHLGKDIEKDAHIQMPMKQIVDGILFRGNWEAQNQIAPRPDNIYADTNYLNELIRREQLVNIPNYRTRLYFYKIIGTKEFNIFDRALKKKNHEILKRLYQPLNKMIPPAHQKTVLIYSGHFYLKKKDIKKSLAVFNLAAREYPDHYQAYEGMGDAYAAKKKKHKAVQHYEEALKINPNNQNIRIKLEKIKSNNF